MRRKNLLLLLAVILVFFLFSSSVFLQGVFEGASAAAGRYAGEHPVLGPALFVILAAFSVMLGPFTSTPLVPLVIPVWGIGLTLVFLLSGWLLGNLAAYWLGRKVGFPIARLFASRSSLDRWTAILSRQVSWTAALLFRLATPSETGYVFGVLRYPLGRYLAITLIAEIPFALITVFLGESFARAGWQVFLALIAAWVAIIAIAVRLLVKQLKKAGIDSRDL